MTRIDIDTPARKFETVSDTHPSDDLNIIRGLVLAGFKVAEACMGDSDGAHAVVTVCSQAVEKIEALLDKLDVMEAKR